VIVLPTALIGATSGAPARFATVMLSGMVFSPAAALTVLPVLAWLFRAFRRMLERTIHPGDINASIRV
jgi:hypothetical protein